MFPPNFKAFKVLFLSNETQYRWYYAQTMVLMLLYTVLVCLLLLNIWRIVIK